MGVKVVHVYKSYNPQDEGDYLPDVKRSEEQEEKECEAREPAFSR
jgi:hypothetical protein